VLQQKPQNLAQKRLCQDSCVSTAGKINKPIPNKDAYGCSLYCN